jgi:hypothetical protein
MIELLRTEESPEADHIEERLQAMSAAYKKRILKNEEGSIKGTSLPAIVENGTIIFSREQIDIFLKQLGEDIIKWSRFTGDYCYLDDDGKVC